MSELQAHFETSDALCRYVRELTGDTVLLAFSNGKDSIATWVQLRKHFPKIIPYYRCILPGLRFVEESLRYFEERFETPILRYPDPALYWMLDQCVYQPPERRALLDGMMLHRALDNEAIMEDVRRKAGSPTAWVGVGWRSSDSLRRRLVIKKYGSARHRDRKFFPVFDWNNPHIIRALDENQLQLPVDYAIFFRSFEALTWRYLEPLKRHYPDDYERIRLWFPLIEADFARRRFGTTKGEEPDEADDEGGARDEANDA